MVPHPSVSQLNRVAMATCPWILFIPLQAVVIFGTLTPGPRPGILFQQPWQPYPGVHGGDLKTAPAAQDSSAKGSLSPSQGPPSSQAASCPLDTKHHWRLLTKYWLNLGLSCSNLPENTDPAACDRCVSQSLSPGHSDPPLVLVASVCVSGQWVLLLIATPGPGLLDVLCYM